MSDDTPTVRFDQPAEPGVPGAPYGGGPADPGGPTPGGPDDDSNRSRRLVIILSIVGGVLLLAVIILLVVLFGARSSDVTPTPTVTSNSPSPTPTATSPSPTPTPTQTNTPPPPSTEPAVTNFTVSTNTVQCPTANSTVDITFSWTSTKASSADFGIDTNDASLAPYFTNLPPNGSTVNFPAGNNPFQYTCSSPSHKYTITVIGNGQKASKSVVVTATQ